ncbi:hypothetical protein BDN70DRAFT_887164 [Pholiota conissans]|uniref:DUF6699 domain-containing protein n=1 Tax=Pholiota conissans TaxID=109636 RepID=A0A9P5YPF4_9AGAR|nr:hypothetical protein BDN70DRAFT_887164 [Pholiota conissans]
MTCPPSAARLATSFNAYDTTTSHWSHENALEPATMPSLTIRIASIERPIVVFPSEMDRSVHIADVLDAVYVALRFEALEDQRRSRSGRFSATIANVGWIGAGTSIGDPSAEGSEIAYAIRRFYNGDVWWNGMHESVEERDVWILELRVARGVWY